MSHELLRAHLEGEILRHAVGRAILCPVCGDVLDCRGAVLVETDQDIAVVCCRCWDRTRSHVFRKHPDAEVTDGRELEW